MVYHLMFECGVCGRLSSGPSCKYHGYACQQYPVRVVKGDK